MLGAGREEERFDKKKKKRNNITRMSSDCCVYVTVQQTLHRAARSRLYRGIGDWVFCIWQLLSISFLNGIHM